MRHKVPRKVYKPAPDSPAVLLSLLAGVAVFVAFQTSVVGLWVGWSVFLISAGSWLGYVYVLGRRVNRPTSKKPHEVIDDFFLWEKGDRIRIGRGRGIDNWVGGYKGVTAGGTILLNPYGITEEPDEYIYICGRECSFNDSVLDGDYLRISPAVFEELPFENKGLKERREKELLEQETGSYDELVEEVKRKLRDEDLPPESDPAIDPIEFPSLRPGS